MVDENPAHHAGGDGEQMHAVLPGDVRVDQAELGLVNQGRGRQGMAAVLILDGVSREFVELLIDDRDQGLERGLVPGAPGAEEFSDGLGRFLH